MYVCICVYVCMCVHVYVCVCMRFNWWSGGRCLSPPDFVINNAKRGDGTTHGGSGGRGL